MSDDGAVRLPQMLRGRGGALCASQPRYVRLVEPLQCGASDHRRCPRREEWNDTCDMGNNHPDTCVGLGGVASAGGDSRAV
jgi:hypothetical protein